MFTFRDDVYIIAGSFDLEPFIGFFLFDNTIGASSDGTLLSDVWKGVVHAERTAVEWFSLTTQLQFAGTVCVLSRFFTPFFCVVSYAFVLEN